ncbi:MAG: VWA domain-containing protein [Cyclobacteriaceae bacterium]|nr:VWA domain-containing protein [Cyclobacteriaceae bacterium]
MAIFHYTNHQNIDEAMLGFTAYCREHNLCVGLSHSLEAINVSAKCFLTDQNTLRYALKALFCTCEEEFEVFNKCFDVYWGKRKHEYAHKIKNSNSSNVTKKANASLVMMGFKPNGDEKDKEEEEDTKNVSGASRVQALKRTDFSKIGETDNRLLDEIAKQLLHQLNHRLKRKMESTKKGKIDLRKTIRRNIPKGDMLLELSRKNRKQEKFRINLLLDVSGSMDKYSFFLLKFIWSLKSHLKQIEAFVFSTKLVRITDLINEKELNQTLLNMSYHTDNWSGGTRIGECLRDFNENYAKRTLNGKSITIVLSDGLDTGEVGLLTEELRKIKMRTNKLVWLNPLKGMSGYIPEAKGMKAALSEIDQFESAHNLESLMKLENILADA